MRQIPLPPSNLLPAAVAEKLYGSSYELHAFNDDQKISPLSLLAPTIASNPVLPPEAPCQVLTRHPKLTSSLPHNGIH